MVAVVAGALWRGEWPFTSRSLLGQLTDFVGTILSVAVVFLKGTTPPRDARCPPNCTKDRVS